MAHMIEFRDGKDCMAYAGETPWHGLGKQVPADISPNDMLKAAGLDWKVNAIPAFAEINGKQVDIGHSALVRDVDNKILDVITNDWVPNQNEKAFEFFNDFVAAGEMEMHTAGSLKDGQLVWALAKVKDAFELFNGDTVESYLLFTNPHKYGWSIDVRFTPIRVVCNNTLTLSLNTQSSKIVKVSHRREFDGDLVKETLGVAKEKLAKYKEMAEFISTKRFTEENKVEYLERLFPVLGEAKRKKQSKGPKNILELLHTQPGAELGEGTFWQLYNGVTYYVDHEMGRTDDNRLNNAWFGAGVKKKQDALDLALEMAEVA